jgi:hypothetical protein
MEGAAPRWSLPAAALRMYRRPAAGKGPQGRKGTAMKKYNANASTSTRTTFGHELRAGLLGFAETAPLADLLRPVNDRLREAAAARADRYLVVVETRAAVRIAENAVEREIRTFARMVEVQEGGRRGPAFRAVFVDGLDAAVTPRRRAQARELRNMIQRLSECVLPAAVAVAGEWLPRLTGAAERFEASLAAHETALAEYDAAFRTELTRRGEHSRVVDELIGRVRALFPEDRSRQDAVFPVVDSSSSSKGATEEEEPASPTTEPTVTPA